MISTQNRRGFLSSLACLPLIGGGVTLIGQPTAAAVPVTEELMTRYLAWLVREHAETLVELSAIQSPIDPVLDPEAWARTPHRRDWQRQPLYWFPEDAVAHSAVLGSKPSTRAAAILSTAGCALPGMRP